MRIAILAATALFALPQFAHAQAKVTMGLSHQLPPAHHIAKVVEAFAADVKARSNGEVEVKVFGASQAHKPNENFPAVARGSIESALSVNFQWGNTIPEMNVTVIPYFLTDLEKLKKFPGSPAAALLESKLESKGVKNIAWLYTTRQSIFTSGKKPIVATDDFKGIKIRGLNKLADAALEAVGAAPSALPGDEVYNGLQTGIIDAGLTDVSAAYSRKYYEVQKFGTVAPYFSVYFHVYVNPAWWNKLEPKHRDAIAAAADKAERDSIAITEKTAEDAIVELGKKGMQVHVQTPAESKAWEAQMQKPVMDGFLKASPEDGAKLIDAIKKL